MRTIVITRSAEQASGWLDAFQSKGIAVMHVPLLRITAAEQIQPILNAWENIHHWNWVMFVSPNAVKYFFHYAEGRQWPPHLRVGSPGEGTTQALIEAGVSPNLIDQPHSDQEKDTDFLWENIKNRHWNSTRVLLVRGSSNRPPRDWLMNQLQEVGAFVQPLVVYQRESGIFSDEARTWITSEQARHACWILSSVESLESLAHYDWTQAAAIVIHPRIANAAYELGFGQVISTQPDLNSLIDSVESVV